jgi:type II secretory pathway pseudopilin PulG
MTLVEVMVAMAIIAIVAIMCVSAFMTVIGSETRETNARLASERAEERIATGAGPTTQAAVALPLGAFTIPADVNTYSETVGTDAAIATENGQIDTSGNRSYSVLTGNDPPALFAIYFGAGAGRFEGKEGTWIAQDTGEYPDEVSSTMKWPVVRDGRYRIEVWGAAGGTAIYYSDTSFPHISSPGKGGYSTGEVRLSQGEELYLHAGGKGVDGNRLSGSDEIPGGANGGGGASFTGYTASKAGGGGASDVRIKTDSLYSRVIVAGGGGGGTAAGSSSTVSNSGAGGGYEGGSASGSTYAGTGGTQYGGGIKSGDSPPKYYDATFGAGGGHIVGEVNLAFAGGGGGWYGGAAGISAGGGSGWVFTASNFNSWFSNNSTDASGFLLTKDEYKDADGDFKYELTNEDTVRGDNTEENMPNPLYVGFNPKKPDEFGTLIEGNSGGGFVRIVYLGS